MNEITCPLCGGTGKARQQAPPPSHAETVRKAVSLVTLALDHAIRGDDQAFTEQEMWAVLGDPPLAEVIPQLAMVTSVTASVLRNVAEDDDSAREWWSRISQWLLDAEDAR